MRFISVRQAILLAGIGLATVGTGADAHAATWNQFTSTGQPGAWIPSSVPIGGNSVIAVMFQDPLASSYLDIVLLGQTASGSDHRVREYQCTNPEPPPTCDAQWEGAGGDIYYSGVSASGSTTLGQTFTYGWTSGGQLYQGAQSTYLTYSGIWSSPTEIRSSIQGQAIYLGDSYDYQDVLSINENGMTCGTSGYPHGNCLSIRGTGGSWTGWKQSNVGVVQITQDGVYGNDYNLLALDSSGTPWIYDESSNAWSSVAGNYCSGQPHSGAFTAAQVALNNDGVYALEYNAGGASDVYEYPILEGCWSEVATPPGGPSATSWATSMTAPVSNTYLSANGVIWATDTSGQIWYVTP